MKKGLVLTILGSLLALVGLTVLPFFELEQLLMTVTGYEFAFGQALAGAIVLPIIASVVIIALRLRREYGVVNLALGIGALVLLLYIFFDSPAIFQTKVIIGLLGYYLVSAGIVMIMVGGIATMAAEPEWQLGGNFLRVAQLYRGSIMNEHVWLEPEDVTVGEDLRATFSLPLPDLPKRFKLFRSTRAGDYKVGLSNKMHGKVQIAEVKSAIKEYVEKHTTNTAGINYVPVTEKDWGMINMGDLQLFFQFIQQDERIPKAGFSLDRNILGTVLISAILQFAFIFFALFTWEERPISRKIRDITKLMQVNVDIEKEEDPELLDLGEEEDTTGKQAEGEEGKFGDPDIDPDMESKVPKRDGKMVKEIDPKKVGLNDLLSSSKLGGSGAISNILSSDMTGFSNKIAVAMSGTGAEFVMGHGSGGLGFRGTGRGGGGTGGYGRIQGLGKVDTGGGVGMKASLGRKGKRKVARINFGSGSAEGFCEKSNIRKIVLRRKGAIKACYEQQLLLNPKLSGKIDIRWTINQTGKVQSATVISSSMKNSQVENCVVRQIRRMRFSKPKGGICIVKWPFVFNPSG